MSGGPKTPEPTDQEWALAEQPVQKRNLYTEQYIPQANRLIEDIRNSEQYFLEMRGMATTDVGLESAGQLDNASNTRFGYNS